MNVPAARSLSPRLLHENQSGLGLIERAVAFFIVSVPMLFIATEGIFGDRIDFLLLSGVFMAYVLTEIFVFARQRRGPWLLNPPVLTTLYVFFLGYGLTNFLYLIPGFEYNALRNLVASQYEWLSYSVFCAMLGAFAMWIGFGFSFGASLGRGLRGFLLSRNVLRAQFQPRWSVVVSLVMLSFAARVIQWQLQIYGVLAATQGVAPPAYNQYLIMARNLGLIALLVTSITYFSSRPGSFKLRLLVIGLVLHECAWGLLAADKTLILLPIVMVGLCHYALRGRIPKSWVVGGLIALVVAFLVAQPLRRAGFDEGTIGIGAVTAATTAIAIDQWNAGSDAVGADLGTSVSERLSFTGRTALGIWFRDEGAEGREPPVNMIMLLVTSPVAAILPRTLWPSKPSGSEFGNWVYTEVLGRNPTSTTRVGMGPVGYLYLAGGELVIVLAFLVLGVAHRVIWTAFFERRAGGLLIFLGLIPSVVFLSSVFYDFVINGFRTFLILLVIQYVVFKGEPLRADRIRTRSHPGRFRET